ncbi:MAG: Hsp20/alpha crystallin family protein [Candidatus Korarchaeota archaeon]|nr:Hsp20/alpha crystallin family protein [Candidatus Korarchaeota archaeon]NIU84527.1 Hsp20 family protein [Candidatus Thorarchaeota archaeon]NIW14594.1 Hsp20 family protein [Candidatus Thorarchaeota archaeon]NIW52666.1 Hsp20 family protein [Candidatus Korarchaeota archaeon]
MDHFYFYIEKRKKESGMDAHLLEEADFSCEEHGVARPNVYERKEANRYHYLIELDGVKRKKDIDVSLEAGDVLNITAKPSLQVIYRSLSGNIPIKEYRARIQIPMDVDAEDIGAEFKKKEEMLHITVQKPKKAKEIEVK